MKKNGFFLDLTDFTNTNNLFENEYTIITISKTKHSPFREYLFRNFKFKAFNQKTQKLILETFYQLNYHHCQYLQCYKYISFSFQSTKNILTFSTKYTPSKTLEETLKSPDFLEKWTVCDILQCLFAVAKGIYYLHSNLLYHGNLCPSNIIVDRAKQCYICDFGLYPIKKIYMRDTDMFDKDYKDPCMNSCGPTFVNDVYSYGFLICKLCL